MAENNEGIAVVGIACQFPGARNKDEFWTNLIDGKESISRLEDDELEKYEVSFPELKKNPNFVKSRGVLKDIESWDPSFFGFTPHEAKYMDPQQRLWLETVWNSFEDAGCNPYGYKGSIGVFGGTIQNTYLLNNILRTPVAYENYIRNRSAQSFQSYLSNEPGYLATRTAYVFDLKGPAISVQTACSTSLVAISQACSSLFSFETDMCIAGGVSILVPQQTGYVYQEGAIVSPDGHCRPFDVDGKGTVFGNGVGVVVLKRLEDAINDNDRIYSVIKGWALNNDGRDKVGYTAPSVEGQSEAISMAHTFADISPEKISYVEAHGTATPLGDPIEVAALTKAFRAKTSKKQYCGLGSVKSNVGHLDAAAGVAGFIKVALSSYYKTVPPTLHYKSPNPRLKIEESPFYVNAESIDLSDEREILMGVSSFGVGGTNAHVLVQNHIEEEKILAKKRQQLLLLSAKSEGSLKDSITNHTAFINKNQEKLAEIAYTLQNRRADMNRRAFAVLENGETLEASDFKVSKEIYEETTLSVVFLFPGQGAQFKGMAEDLYADEPVFKEHMDELFELYKRICGDDIRPYIFNGVEKSAEDLSDTEITQPALFIVEYSMAKLYQHYGVSPDMMIGHSVGEYVAACLSGVFVLEDALKVVIKRGQLMKMIPAGNMYAVFTREQELKLLNTELFEIAGVNSSNLTVISVKKGNDISVIDMLNDSSLKYVKLDTSHAFHSSDFDPILSDFSEYVASIKLSMPEIPFISCVSGAFITDEDAVSNLYWAKQLRSPVRFFEGINHISEGHESIFLEVGPNTHLASNLYQNDSIKDKDLIISSLGKEEEKCGFFTSLGKIWTVGVQVNFNSSFPEIKPTPITLPGYSYNKQRCWIDFSPSMIESDIGLEKKKEDDNYSFQEASDHNVEQDEDFSTILEQIWTEVLGLEIIDHKEDLFSLGGHSLSGLQILNRIKEDFEVEIPLREFLENSSIDVISKRLQSNQDNSVLKNTKILEEILLEEMDLSDKIPLTNDQKRLWLITMMDEGNPAYNIPFALSFKGKMSIQVLKDTLEKILSRHQVLKTIITIEEGEPVGYLKKGADSSISVIDWTEKPDKQESSLQKYLSNDIRKSFNFDHGPLYRFEIIRVDNNHVVLYMNVHHVIIDGWSWGVITNEISTIYNDLIENKEVSLPELQAQYYHYAKWLDQRDFNEFDKQAEAYWVKKLLGIKGVINFPYDHKRKDIYTGIGGRIRHRMPVELTKRINTLRADENVSLFTMMISAFGLLMNRYSQDDDICIGVPIANRLDQRFEDMIGLFVNTLVMRLEFGNVMSFRELLLMNQSTIREAFSYQEYPFDKLVEAIQPERLMNINPVFQILFAWQNTPKPKIEIDGVEPELFIVNDSVSPLDLSVYGWEIEDYIEWEFEYSKDLFDDHTIYRMIANFEALLWELVETIDKDFNNYKVLSAEDEILLERFNDTECEIPKLLLHELFQDTAEKYTDKIAVVSGKDCLSYGDLDEQSNQLANYLKSKGVVDGDLVGLSVSRGVSMLVAVLGILKSGAAYLPLDPSFPDERLVYMLEDSGAKMLISEEKIATRFKKVDFELILLDEYWRYIKAQSRDALVLGISNQDLAYVIYTSGSTGKPKGVKVHHEAVVNFLLSMAKEPGFNEDNILLAVTTLSFDISVLELFLPLVKGGKVVVAGVDDIIDGNRLITLIEKENIDVLQATPVTWNILLQSNWSGKASLKALCGGEEVPASLVNKLLPLVSSIWNVYGPTETTVWSACKELKNSSIPVLIGNPIDNTQIYFLDKFLNIVPIGVFGELCIGGLGVTKGYHKRESLNEEKFINHSSSVLYRTGDVGRYCSDGQIELLGRIDNQIKLRGYRIEPGEIENLLCKIDGINEAVVKLISFSEYDDRLVGFIKSDIDISLNNEEISNFLKTDIPDYMIPSMYKVMKDFPRTANGKIDRGSLSVAPEELSTQVEDIVEPSSEIELKLREIWSKRLSVSNISILDNFFEIGGNSLMAVALVSEIETEFGIELGLRSFFDAPRIKGLAEYVEIRLDEIGQKDEDEENPRDNIITGEI